MINYANKKIEFNGCQETEWLGWFGILSKCSDHFLIVVEFDY